MTDIKQTPQVKEGEEQRERIYWGQQGYEIVRTVKVPRDGYSYYVYFEIKKS